jgi:Cof subfamily protein (haloacid dehalogenase superfamily)
MRKQIEALGIDLPTVAFNGANVINPDGSLLKAHRIDPRAARTSLELFAGEQVAVWVFADDQWLLIDPQGDYVEHERNTLGYNFVKVDRFDDYIDRIDKIVAASKDFELLKRLEAQLNPLIAETARAARSQFYYLDVTALDANKGTALETLAKTLGLELTQTAVIGDAGNDVAMFLRAGLSIAMGQAETGVKTHANYVTDSNLEDGLATAIERYILPR